MRLAVSTRIFISVLLIGVLQLQHHSLALKASVVPAAASGPGTATGTAIGNGFNAFFKAAFPEGSTLVNLIQGWLKKKLNGDQQTQVKNGADAKSKAPLNDPVIKAAVEKLQNAGQVFEYCSVLLDHSNHATITASSMLATLKATKPGDPMPADFTPNWNSTKAELDAMSEDGVLSKVRAATTDVSVIGALQQLERASKAPVTTLDSMINGKENAGKPLDRDTAHDQLTQIVSATSQFNNLATALLGSTGIELIKETGDLTKSGGSSDLTSLAQTSVERALKSIPAPQQPQRQ